MNVAVRTLYVLSEEASDSFKDLDIVRTKIPVEDEDGRLIPSGTTGTIVSTYAEGAAFLVEFNEDVGMLATINTENLRLVLAA